jgi:hypothetical protein
MRSVKGRVGVSAIGRRLVMASLAIPLCGCAAMTQDVDAYYRQMAVNFKESLDDAKREEADLEKKSKVYALTGDKKEYRKAQRELDRVRDWVQHCSYEQKRFEKAAKWMESHFDLETKDEPGPSETTKTSVASGPAEVTGAASRNVEGPPGS